MRERKNVLFITNGIAVGLLFLSIVSAARLRSENRLLTQYVDTLKRADAARPPAPPPSGEMKADPTLSPRETVETDIATAAQLGSADAHLVVIEFTDFECPFCGQYSRETFFRLNRDYIAKGTVRYAVRNLPLERLHPFAFKAAEAAACAAEQGKYWEMHDALFRNQRAFSLQLFALHAEAIDLDRSRFNKCIGDGRAMQVKADIAEAQRLGVRSTPLFLIGTRERGSNKVRVSQRIDGAQSYETFRRVLDSMLPRRAA